MSCAPRARLAPSPSERGMTAAAPATRAAEFQRGWPYLLVAFLGLCFGVPGMPIYGIGMFLPHFTAAERVEMERYNPKGLDDRAEEQQENDFLNRATPKPKRESQNQHPR